MLFAETLRKVGDTLTSAATRAAADKVANQVAELVGRWLGQALTLVAARVGRARVARQPWGAAQLVDDQPLYEGTMTVSGGRFQPYETILVRVDGDYVWETATDASGAYSTSQLFGPTPRLPRCATMTGLSSGRRTEAWF